MKTIKIPREIKEMIAEEFDDGTNNAIKQMLEENIMPHREITGGRITIEVDDAVIDALKGLKLYATEPYGSVLLRLILSHKGKW